MANSFLKFPLHVQKNIGPSPGMLIWPALILILLRGGPILFSGGDIIDTIINSSETYILASIVLLLVFVYFMYRNPATLDIGEDGIKIFSNKRQYFYAWSDISDVVRVKNAIRLKLTGRSSDENQYNLISDRFGLNLDELAATLRDGIARWGGGLASNRTSETSATAAVGARSIIPADSPKTAVSGAFKGILLLQGLVFCGVLAWVVIWQISDYRKAVEIQRHGLKADAAVVRFYQDSCGRSGCSMNVKYSFIAGPGSTLPGKLIVGHAYIAGDDYVDNANYKYAAAHNSVPIAYDSTHPARSALNFNNEVFKRTSLASVFISIGILGSIISAVFGFVAAALIYSMKQAEKKLIAEKTSLQFADG
jgi:hypothetical protein